MHAEVHTRPPTDSGVETETNANQHYQKGPACALHSNPRPASTPNTSNEKEGISQEQQGSFLLTMDQHKQTQQKEDGVLQKKDGARSEGPPKRKVLRVNRPVAYYSPVRLVFYL